MSDTPSAGPAPRTPTPNSEERRTVSRAAGLTLTAITAGIVFAAGAALWPAPPPPTDAPAERQVAALSPEAGQLPAAPPIPQDATPAPAAPGDGAASAADARSGGDGTATAAATSASDAAPAPPPAPDAAAAVATAAPADSEAGEEPAPSKRLSKKRRRELARAAAAAARAGNADGGVAAGADAVGRESSRDNAPLPPSDGSAAAPSSPALQGAKDADVKAGKEAAKDLKETKADKEGKAEKDDNEAKPGKESASNPDCSLPEKELAKESWRRNWPAVCPMTSAGKAFILIPLKGSLEGESHAVHRRPTREARVNLPPGSGSLLTLKQYKVKRLGFKDLRVSITEDGGTRLRVKLQPGAGDPVFEVKDGYAKITIATPTKS